MICLRLRKQVWKQQQDLNDFGAYANKFGIGPFFDWFLMFVLPSWVIFENLLDT